MAEIFISYARADHDIAQRLSDILSERGHSVWWDFNLYGGERYQDVIEEKLAAADAVIVLWSKSSVKSVWVSDEASIGRDGEKLIPLIIDDVSPPLGFRHIQSIKYPTDNEHAAGEAGERLLSAVKKITGPRKIPSSGVGDNPPAHGAAEAAASRSPARIWRPPAVIAAAAVICALLLGAGYFLRSSTAIDPTIQEYSTLSEGDSIAIPKFSYTGGSSSLEWFAAGVSRSVRHHLTVAGFDIRGYDQGTINGSNGLDGAVSDLDVNYLLVGSITEIQDHFLFSVTLMNAQSRKIVLSLERQEPNNTGIQAVNEIVASIVNLLDAEYLFPGADRNLDPEYYWALGVVSAVDTDQFRSINVDDLKAAAAFLDNARKENPQDSLAWTNLAYVYATIDRQLHVFEREALAREALANAMDAGGQTSDVHLADAVVSFTYDDRATRLQISRERLEKALALDRDNIRALKWMSSVLLLQGDYDAALTYIERALAISPNYNDALGNKASLLLLMGDRDAASETINAVLERTPDWGWARRFRSTIRVSQGDLAGALDDLIAAEAIDGAAANELLKSIIYGNLGVMDAADAAIDNEALAALAPAAQQYWAGYKKAIIRDDIEAAFSNLKMIVSELAEDEYPSNVKLALGFVNYYRGAHDAALEQCRALLPNEPNLSTGPGLAETCTAIAAAAAGDTKVAAKLAATYRDAMSEGDTQYTPYWRLSRLAAIYAAQGDDKAALAALEQMYEDGWRSPNTAICRSCLHLRIDHPSGMFASLLNDDDFIAITDAARLEMMRQGGRATAAQ